MNSIHSVHVDWYQARFSHRESIPGMGRIASMRVRVAEQVGHRAARVIFQDEQPVTSGRELRFAHRVYFKGSGASIWFGSQDFFILTLPGQACYALMRERVLTEFISATYGTCSRIDIAVDLETDHTPFEVSEDGHTGRQVSVVNSKTGQTVYLGSRKSDAMARVYRYAKPHARAHLVRTEFEFKRTLAPVVAQSVVTHNVRETAQAACNRFGLGTLGAMLPTAANRLTAPMRGTRDDQGTVLWLQTQVAPAVQRLIEEGVLSPEDVLRILLPPSDGDT